MKTLETICTAKTVEEAIQLAAQELGASLDKLKIEVLEEPKKGLFGGLKGEAKVKAVYEYEPSKIELAMQYLEKVLVKLEIPVEIVPTEVEGGVVLDIKGEGMGVIIGRRGETLDALQYLASLVCNKGSDEYYRITVDSNGYRDKRKATLEELATKIAKTVARTGRTSALEPMNPYERRIIHSAVSNIEGVASRSTGEDPNRKVIISSLNRKPRSFDKGSKPGNRDANRDNKRPQFNKPKGDGFTTSFEKEYKRPVAPAPTVVEEEKSAELYGKIKL